MNAQCNEPILSVIIPTYNRSWGLVRSVESVLSQSYQNFELIIVDDCSPDDTEEVVRSLQDDRIRYFRQPQNVGVAKNWGTGLNLTQGKFVTFLMDDDFYQPDFLANRIVHLESNPSLVVVFSSYELHDLQGNLAGTVIADWANQTELCAADLLKTILARHWFIGASMYRKDAVQSVWELAKRDRLIVDFSLAIYLAVHNAGTGLYLTAPDFIMTQHPGQNSQTKLREVMLQTDQALSRILSEVSEPQLARLIRREQSSWKVLQARYLDLRSRSNLGQARSLIIDALRFDFSNLWAWKQLSKLVLLGKL